MTEKEITFRSACPMSIALDIIGDKWSLLIIRDLAIFHKNTYGDFLKSHEKIATNILADRLVLLEKGGIISRHKHPESKAKVLYKLTAKGIDLIPVLLEFVLWSEKYHNVHPDAKLMARQAKKDKAVVLKTLKNSVTNWQS